MNTNKGKRISTDKKEESLNTNPFGQFDFSEIKLASDKTVEPKVFEEVSRKDEMSLPLIKKQKVYIRKEKAGRGGKTVTVLMGLETFEERKVLLKMIQKQIGCGGTVKEDVIEIQGEKGNEIAKMLRENGYSVILSGG